MIIPPITTPGKTEDQHGKDGPCRSDNQDAPPPEPLSRYGNETIWSERIVRWAEVHPETAEPPDPVEE
jgi:hypothetical protein